jgi:hypothetical protein
MLYLAIKAALSGIIIATVSEVARRSPSLGALIVSLPLVSLLGILWLWHDTGDTMRIASHAQSTFWYVLPTLPMFLALPALLRHGVGFWPTLAACCALTVVLYLITVWGLSKFGIALCGETRIDIDGSVAKLSRLSGPLRQPCCFIVAIVALT